MSFRPALILLLGASFAFAQAPATQQPATPATPPAATTSSMPQAKPADVDTIDHIVAALYDVISGPAGQARDWDRFRSLFIPEGRLIPNAVRPDGSIVHTVLGVEDYVVRGTRGFAQQGFYESESSRKEEHFDNIAHVFSTYESRHEKGGQPFARGINSIQLLRDGQRWYIVTIMWEAESPKVPIPAEYQNGKH